MLPVPPATAAAREHSTEKKTLARLQLAEAQAEAAQAGAEAHQLQMAVAGLQVTQRCATADSTSTCHQHWLQGAAETPSGATVDAYTGSNKLISVAVLQERETELQRRLAGAGAGDATALQDEASQLRMENAMLKARWPAVLSALFRSLSQYWSVSLDLRSSRP